MSAIKNLECAECGDKFNANVIQTFCKSCYSPLLVRYDLDAVRGTMKKELVRQQNRGIWRWRQILPVRDQKNIVTLGEGDSPILKVSRLSEVVGLRNLYLKDESGQPTGTFKARGLAVAVSKAVELGVQEFVIPTAGNAGGALSAYAARAGKKSHIFMPSDAPTLNILEVKVTGAELHLVNGLISDAGKLAASVAKENNWFDVSTLKEPYRLEGKKTMGLEIAEYFNWELPDVIIYPTGGGTGLIGMWKAFQELEQISWIGTPRPKMVAVQSEGCAPIERAFYNQRQESEFWENARTIASGLRVPHAFGNKLILNTIYESDGIAVAVTDEEILAAQELIAESEGIFAAPEGAATLAGAIRLVEMNWLDQDDRIVLLNTGTGLKYSDVFKSEGT